MSLEKWVIGAVCLGVVGCSSDGSSAAGPAGGTAGFGAAASGGASSGGASSGGASSGGASSGGASSGGTTATGGAPTTCDGEPTHTGQATYYTFADGTGNCGFDATPNDLMVGAMNDTDYAGSAVCGACAHVVGPKGEVTVRVVDRCPECPQGNIDLSPEAFSKIADLPQGKVAISWEYVPCNVTGPIVYHFKDGSSQWWTAVQIRNHRNRVAKLEYKDGSGSYVNAARVDYNYFIEDKGMGPGPFDFRVTDVYGNVLTDTGIALVENGNVDGLWQFPACGGP